MVAAWSVTLLSDGSGEPSSQITMGTGFQTHPERITDYLIPFKSTASGRETQRGGAGPASHGEKGCFVSRFPLKDRNGKPETGNE